MDSSSHASADPIIDSADIQVDHFSAPRELAAGGEDQYLRHTVRLWTRRSAPSDYADHWCLSVHGFAERNDMSADKQGGALTPVKPARVAEELRKLCSQRKDGTLAADEYEHRFARMIGELRDRRIDGSRAEILATLNPLMNEGVISAAEWQRLTKQLGLA